MGGFGSTRWTWHPKKYSVEDCLILKVERLVKDTFFFRPGKSFGLLCSTITHTRQELAQCWYTLDVRDPSSSQLWLSHKVAGAQVAVEYTVQLEITKPHFGGIRRWFTCPICGRRVGTLYLPPGGKYFGCRHCYDLTYTSCQRNHEYDRVYARLASGFPGMTVKEMRRLLDRNFKREKSK